LLTIVFSSPLDKEKIIGQILIIYLNVNPNAQVNPAWQDLIGFKKSDRILAGYVGFYRNPTERIA
jgi:hypothetical protein